MNFVQEIFDIKNAILSNNIAVRSSSGQISYVELASRLDKAAAHLKNLGIRRNEYAAVLSNNSPEFITLIFSLWKLCAIPVILNSRLLEGEIHTLLSLTGSKRLFISEGLAYKFNSDIIQKIIFPFNKFAAEDNTDFKINLDSTAVVIFTSGSTGMPKGVEITFNNLLQSALTGNQYFKHRKNDRWLASLPFYHIGGFSIIIRSFLFGATLLFPEDLGIKSLSESFSNMHPTHASLVSTQIKRFVESGVKPNKELREVLLGGGFIDSSLIISAIKKGWNVARSFGASETSSFISVLTAEQFLNKKDSAGKALSPNEILIVDESKNILPPYEIGEIAIKAKSVAKGYLNDPDATNKKFDNGFYYTGDFGYVDADGYMFVEARRNDLIVTGGENVNPIEVEKAVMKHPLIIEASVFGFMDKEWGQIVAAALVTKDNIELSLDDLKSFLSESLASFKHPKKIFIVKSLPRTELGKIQKEKLKEMLSK